MLLIMLGMSTRVQEGDIITAPTGTLDLNIWYFLISDHTTFTVHALPSLGLQFSKIYVSHNGWKSVTRRREGLSAFLERRENWTISDRACYLLAQRLLCTVDQKLSPNTDALNNFPEAKTTHKPAHRRADSTSCIPKIAVQTRNLHRVYKVSGELDVWAL